MHLTPNQLEVLAFLAEARREVHTSEVVRATNLPQSSVSRILDALSRGNLAVAHPYAEGSRLRRRHMITPQGIDAIAAERRAALSSRRHDHPHRP